jgi:hypothetical protein
LLSNEEKIPQELQEDTLSYDGHCPFQHNRNPLQKLKGNEIKK